jgi:hypothetical protein
MGCFFEECGHFGGGIGVGWGVYKIDLAIDNLRGSHLQLIYKQCSSLLLMKPQPSLWFRGYRVVVSKRLTVLAACMLRSLDVAR